MIYTIDDNEIDSFRSVIRSDQVIQHKDADYHIVVAISATFTQRYSLRFYVVTKREALKMIYTMPQTFETIEEVYAIVYHKLNKYDETWRENLWMRYNDQ